MAFTLEKFDTIKQNHDGTAICFYRETGTILSTIIASGYFDDMATILATGSLIFIVGSDGFGLYQVTNTSDVITISGKVNLPALGSAAASASGLLMGVGTTAAPVSTSIADAKFIEIRAQNSATSGDNRLGYFRFNLSGAGGGGECLRCMTDLTAAVSTARGAHISLQADDAGYVSGLGVGVDAQIYVKPGTVGGGTYAAVNAEIYGEDATSSITGTTTSFFRAVNGGHSTAKGVVDDTAYLFDLSGFTSGAAHLWYDNQKAAPAVEEFVKVKTPSGDRYLGLYNANA